MFKMAVPASILVFYAVALLTSISAMEIGAGLIALFVIYQIARGNFRPVPKLPFLLPMALFICVVGIGILLGSTSLKEKIYDFGRMRFFLVYIFVYLFLIHTKLTPLFLKVLLWGSLFLGVYGVFQHFIPIDIFRSAEHKNVLYAIQDEAVGPLVLGAFNHHLTYSNVMLSYACIFFAMGLRQSFKLLIGLLLFLTVFWTQSRAAWVAIPICLFLILIAKNSRWAFGSLLFFLLLAIGSFYWDPGFRQRLQLATSQHTQLSTQPRLHLWHANWEMFKAHPWFGVGFNNNERQAKPEVDKLYPNSPNFYGHAHSTPLQLLSSTGIFGLLSYLFIWVSVFLKCFDGLKLLGKGTDGYWALVGLIAAFVGFQVQGLTQWNFGDAEVLHNLMFVWALLAVTAPSRIPR